MRRLRFKRALALLMAIVMIMSSSSMVMAAETAGIPLQSAGTENQPAGEENQKSGTDQQQGEVKEQDSQTAQEPSSNQQQESVKEPTQAPAADSTQQNPQDSAKTPDADSADKPAQEPEQPGQTSEEGTAGTENGDSQVTYVKKTAEKSGKLYLVVEHSSDGNTTDGLVVDPVQLIYNEGETILDIVNRLDGITFTENFGEVIEDGRLLLNDSQYVATADAVTGAVTLSDTVRPDEIKAIRIHQNVNSTQGLDYFPIELQDLIAAMADYREFAAQQDPKEAREAYDAAVNGYAEAVNNSAKAKELTEQLDNAVLQVKEAAEKENSVPEPEADMENEAKTPKDESAAALLSEQKTYEVQFKITYGATEVDDAEITVTGSDNKSTVNTKGNYGFNLKADSYSYEVKADEYEDAIGTFTIKADQEGRQTVYVSLIPTRAVKYSVQFKLSCDDSEVTDANVSVTDYTGSSVGHVSGEKYSYELPRGTYKYKVYLDEKYETGPPAKFRPYYKVVTGSFEVKKSSEPLVIEEKLEKIEYPTIYVGFGGSAGIPVTGFNYYREWADGKGFTDDRTYEELKNMTMLIPDYQFTGLAIAASAGIGQDTDCTVTYNRKSNGEKVTVKIPAGTSTYNYFSLNDCIALGAGGNQVTVTAESPTLKTQVYNFNVEFRYTLKGLTAEANSIATPIVPQFSADTYDYTVEVPKGTESISLSPTPFKGSAQGYEVTVNGQKAEDGKSVEVALDGQKDETIPIVVSNTADGETGKATYRVLVKQVTEKTYQTTIRVRTGADQGSEAVEKASVTVKNRDGEVMKPANEGGNVYDLLPGIYDYEVMAEGYTPSPRTGSFEVGYSDRTVEVILSKGEAQQQMLQQMEIGASMWTDPEGEFKRIDTVEIQPGIYEYWLDVDMRNLVPYTRATLTEEAAKGKDIKIVSSYEYSRGGQQTAQWYNGKLDSYLGNIAYLSGRQFTLDITSGEQSEHYIFHLNRIPTLSNMAASVNGIPQELTPKFDSNVTEYELTVDQKAEKLEIEAMVSAIKDQDGDYAESMMEEGSYTISIGGVKLPIGVKKRTVPIGDVGSTEHIPVVIRDNETGDSETYTITVKKIHRDYVPMVENVYLQLQNSKGWNPEPELNFDSDTYDYNIDADSDINRFEIRVDLLEKYKDSKVVFKGTTGAGEPFSYTYQDLELGVTGSKIMIGSVLTDKGPDNTMSIVVTSKDGEETQTYNLHFTRKSFLSKLSAYADDKINTPLQLAPTFTTHSYDGNTEYQIYTPKDAKTVTIDAVPYSNADDTMFFDGEPMLTAVTVPVSDDPEESTHTLTVCREGENSGRDYTLKVSKVHRTLVEVKSGGERLPGDDYSQYISLGVYDSKDKLMTPNYTETKALGLRGTTVYDLPDGTYTYNAYSPGYKRTQGSFEVKSQESTVQVDLEKYPEGPREITFRATYEGKPLENVQYQVANNSVHSKYYEPKEDDKSTFVLDDGEGYYYIIRAKGYQYKEERFNVEGENATIEVELEKAKSDIEGETRDVTLTVLGLDGEPVLDKDGHEVSDVSMAVPYFDLSQYYMHDYVWDDTYDEVNGRWYHNENNAVNTQPTMLHLMIRAYEQLMGEKVEFGTSDLNLAPVNEDVEYSGRHYTCNVLSYWGIEGNIYYWFNDEAAGQPDWNAYTTGLPEGANIIIQLYQNSLSSNNYYIQTNPKTNTIKQGTALDLSVQYASWGSTKYPSALKANALELRKQKEDGAWDEWQKIEEATDSQGNVSYFFEDAGVYQIRPQGPYSVTNMNKAGARIVRIPATITVEEAELTPVDISFRVTDLGEDITDTAKIEVMNSKGEAQSLKKDGKAGEYSLKPGRYTYTAATAEGKYARTLSFIVMTGQEPKTYQMELREELLIQDIDIGNAANVDGWTNMAFDPDGKGIFDYSASLNDTTTTGYIKVLLKDHVDRETARVYATYMNTSGIKTQSELNLKFETTSWISLSSFLTRGSMEGNTVVVTVETPERTQNYTISVGRVPTMKSFSMRSGNKILTPSPEKFNVKTLEYETEVSEDAEEVTVYPTATGADCQVIIEDAKATEDGGLKVKLNETGDTVLKMKAVYQKDEASPVIEGTAYTLTVKKVAYEKADPMTSMIGFYSGYSPAASNNVKFSLDRAFNPAVYDYTLYLPDSQSASYVGMTLNEEEAEGAVVTAKYMNATTGMYSASEIIPMENVGSSYAYLYGFTAAGGAGGEILNIEVKKDNVVQTYVFHVKLNRRLNTLTVKEDGKTANLTLDPVFNKNADIFTYHATASAGAESVNVTAGLYNDKWYDQEDGTPGLGYKLTVNGERVYTTKTAVNVPLTGAKTKIPMEVTYKNELPVEYTLIIEKMPDATVSFHVNPENASIIVGDSEGDLIQADQEDSNKYLLSSGEEYTYVVSRSGYVGQTDTFTAEDGKSIDVTLKEAPKNPDIDTDIEAGWGNFRGNDDNNGVTEAKTPTTADNSMLYWAAKSGEGNAWEGGSPSSPILVGGYLYFYSGAYKGDGSSELKSYLFKMNKDTGEIVDSVEMAGPSSFSITPPTYAEGMIFVALAGGIIQAFNADTMESLWVFRDTFGKALGANQPNSPITYRDGYIYTGFWNAEDKPAHMVCLSVTDEDPSKTHEEKLPIWVRTQEGGFYWAGAYAGSKFVLVGTDDGAAEGKNTPTGNLLSLDPLTGKQLDVITGLNGDVRSSIVHDAATDIYYFTSKGGSFYGVKVNEDGTFTEDSLKSLTLDSGSDYTMSTSTPVVYNGRAYIGFSGGGQFTAYDHHGIAVIDLETFAVAYTANTKGYPQTSGVLASGYDGTAYIYFIDNYTPGTIRVIEDKPGQTELADPITEKYSKNGQEITVENCAPILFTPQGKHADYAISSPIVDENGTLYFKNDSNHIFAVGSAVEELKVVEQPEKTTYVVGESFDPAGMKVVAKLANGIEKDVTSLVTYSTKMLTEKDISIQLKYDYVEYNDKGTAKKPTASVDITVVTSDDLIKVKTAIEKIALIGDPKNVTLESEVVIKEAKAAYLQVPLILMDQVLNHFVLEQAEARLEELKAEQNTIDKFNSAVDDIGSVTLRKEDLIKAARALYNDLTPAQKDAVGKTYLKLEAAEKQLTRLKAEKEEAEANEKAERKQIYQVEELIDAIGSVTSGSAEKIKAARTAFDSLPVGLKGKVSNYSILLSAERAYAQILADQDGDEIKSSGSINGGSKNPTQSEGGVTSTSSSGSGQTSRSTGGVSSSGRIGDSSRSTVSTRSTGGTDESSRGATERVMVSGENLPEGTEVVLKDVSTEVKEQFAGALGTGERILWEREISLTADGKEVKPDGKMEVSVWVGADYEGKTLKVLQSKGNGQMEELTGTVKDGYLVFGTSSLEPVAVVVTGEAVPKAETVEPKEQKADTVKEPEPKAIEAGSTLDTGASQDEGGIPTAVLVLLVVIVVLAAAAVAVGLMIRKKKQDELKK